jgi:hypothetical protein
MTHAKQEDAVISRARVSEQHTHNPAHKNGQARSHVGVHNVEMLGGATWVINWPGHILSRTGSAQQKRRPRSQFKKSACLLLHLHHLEWHGSKLHQKRTANTPFFTRNACKRPNQACLDKSVYFIFEILWWHYFLLFCLGLFRPLFLGPIDPVPIWIWPRGSKKASLSSAHVSLLLPECGKEHNVSLNCII